MTCKESEEVELKLAFDPRDCESMDWAELFGSEPRRIRQFAVYFDTPDHALARAGLSLRIRAEGTRRVQTVKSRHAATGTFVRSEWEFEVEHETPVLDDRTPVQAALGAQIGHLAPIFTIDNERAVWNVGGVEIALDEARVSAGDKALLFSEIEFEAKGADVAALFRLARRVACVVPVDPGIASKADRGYRLLGDASPGGKAATVTLSRSTLAAAAFQLVAQSCIRQFRLNAAPLIELSDPAALHQARVALRRLRTAISVFEPLFPARARARWNEELRWLAEELGTARDLDVLLKRVRSGAVHTRIAVAREAAYVAVKAALVSSRARMLMFDLVEWITIGDWLKDPDSVPVRNAPVHEFAADALDHLRGKLKKRGRKFATLDDQHLHDVRKAAKKLRYAAEFFLPLFPGDRAQRRGLRLVAALESVQDDLGAANDWATASAIARRLGLDEQGCMDAIRASEPGDEVVATAGGTLHALLRRKRFWD